MTRKDYKAIAKILGQNHPMNLLDPTKVWDELLFDFLVYMYDNNSKFDEVKFLKELNEYANPSN
jgi:hypothetical protein